jgi:hypothetical protein
MKRSLKARRRPAARGGPIDFRAINTQALINFLAVLRRLLPSGRPQGHEYVALNPKRADRRLGSFKINLATGRWADFASGDGGGDPISLVAFLFDVSQVEAARRLARMLGIDCGRGRDG